MIKRDSKGCRCLIRSSHVTVSGTRGLFFSLFSQRTKDLRLGFGLGFVGLFCFVFKQTKAYGTKPVHKVVSQYSGKFSKLGVFPCLKIKILAIFFPLEQNVYSAVHKRAA